MRDVDISSPTIAFAYPEKIASSGLRFWLARLFKRKPSHYVISENSPEYLLYDVGIKDGRSPRFDRNGYKLPEW